jgi:hypothetical protein
MMARNLQAVVEGLLVVNLPPASKKMYKEWLLDSPSLIWKFQNVLLLLYNCYNGKQRIRFPNTCLNRIKMLPELEFWLLWSFCSNSSPALLDLRTKLQVLAEKDTLLNCKNNGFIQACYKEKEINRKQTPRSQLLRTCKWI